MLFISNGGEPNSSGASSQVCLHAMGRPLHETLPRDGHEMGYGSECARTRWACGGANRFISSLEPCEVEEEERRASISNAPRTRPESPAAGSSVLHNASLRVIDNR